MDQCNKLLSKAPVSWTDVQKQLMSLIQSRGVPSSSASTISTTTVTTAISSATSSMLSQQTTTSTSSSSSSSMLPINRVLVKQCTDLLIKHLKNLNQNQIVEQLEKFAQTTHLLQIYKTPSEDDPSTVNVFLSTDDFYFEVMISITGEIVDVKFSLFSETAKTNLLLKEIICSWNWDALSKQLDGIKSNYIFNSSDQTIRTKAFKTLQCLEKDLNSLFQIETKYLQKYLKSQMKSTVPSFMSSSFSLVDKLINQSPIGLFKKSDLGEPMRLYYYMSPIDFIAHYKTTSLNQRSITSDSDSHDESKLCASFKNLIVENMNKASSSLENVSNFGIGSHVLISLFSFINNNKSDSNSKPVNENLKFKLPTTSTLLLNESDEKSWQDVLQPYFNSSHKLPHNSIFSIKPNANDIELTGTFLLSLSKPIVMFLSTLNELQSQLGIETIPIDLESETNVPFFELLAKVTLNNKKLNDAYSVQLPDEIQVYYITEENRPDFYGVVVDKLYFTNSYQLTIILQLLRKQLLFNELLVSCMRKPCSGASSFYSKNYLNNRSNSMVRILEVCLIDRFKLSIILQHPSLSCYTTIEIDIHNSSIQTRFRDHPNLLETDILNEILKRSHSIPVTIRTLFAKYSQQYGLKSLHMNDKNGSNGHSNDNNSNNNQDSSKNGNGFSREKKSSSSSNNFQENDSSMNQMNDSVECMHVTPRSLYSSDLNGNPTTPNRLTPSRRDSYNPNGNNNWSNLGNFNFSNVISFEARKHSQFEASLDENVKMSLKSSKSFNDDIFDDDSSSPEYQISSNKDSTAFKKNSANSTPNQLASTKKRKASTSSSRSASPLPSSNSSVQPPQAKRKMINSHQQASDLKRHTSFIEESSDSINKNNISTHNKQKLKTSHSSVDLNTGKLTNENKQQKLHGIKNSSSPSATVLSAALLNTSVSTSKSSPGLKDSKMINKNLSKSANESSNSLKKQSSLSSKSNDPKIRSKEELKAIKDKASKSLNISGLKAIHNLSATEIQLKQPNSNSPIGLGNSSTASTPLSTVQLLQSNAGQNRTPSPSLSSMSSLSWSTSLVHMTTPSPGEGNDPSSASSSDNNSDHTNNKADTKAKLKSKQADSILSKLKATPPSVSALALSMGLGGTSFKGSNFKIPKAKNIAATTDATLSSDSSSTASTATNNDDPLNKNPLSSSSPITSQNKLNSPNKLNDNKSLQSKNNKSMLPPLIGNQGQNRNNMSPKWQSSSGNNNSNNSNNSGNMSPRYNYESSSTSPNPSNANKSGNINQKFNQNKSQQSRMNPNQNSSQSGQGPSNQRPLTPVFGSNSPNNSNNQSNNSRNFSSYNNQKSQQPQPLMSTKQIPPLMSFNPIGSKDNFMMTPKSPSPTNLPSMNITTTINSSSTIEIPTAIPIEPTISLSNSFQKHQIVTNLINDNCESNGPPDSPTCETTTTFTPKLIPLERNSISSDQTNSKSTFSVIKSKQADEIASPDAPANDEEDDDNLIIDINSTANTSVKSFSEAKLLPATRKSTTPTPQITSTFTTRQLSGNSQNEILSPASNSQTSSIPLSAKSPSSTAPIKSTKSPCLIEEDMINDALTG